MPTPPLLSEQRIERGSVVSGPCGLLAIVVGIHGERLCVCKILHRPRHHHRSDVAIGMGDSLTLGVMSGNVVRCRPCRMPRHLFRLKAPSISADLLNAIRNGVEKEAAISSWERCERRSGGVSRIYG